MTPDALYCDGGVIGPNPSRLGVTWAWCWVIKGAVARQESGVLTPDDLGVEAGTNNHSELIAAVRALESVPPDWAGTLYTDSLVTLRRLGGHARLEGCPPWLMERCRANGPYRRPGYRVALVGGHPTRRELAQGHKDRNKLPVSPFNVLCDRLCCERAAEFRLALKRGS